MSTRIVTLSRSGLSACPVCHEHTFIDPAEAADARCRSCGASLAVPEAQRLSRRGMLAQALGRGAAVALFLGVAAAGCKTTQPDREGNSGGGGNGGGGTTPPPDKDAGSKGEVTIRPAPEPGPQPEYGVPMPPPD